MKVTFPEPFYSPSTSSLNLSRNLSTRIRNLRRFSIKGVHLDIAVGGEWYLNTQRSGLAEDADSLPRGNAVGDPKEIY